MGCQNQTATVHTARIGAVLSVEVISATILKMVVALCGCMRAPEYATCTLIKWWLALASQSFQLIRSANSIVEGLRDFPMRADTQAASTQSLIKNGGVMKNATLLKRLLVCSLGGLVVVFAVYLWFGGNPYHRIGYALTISLIPAVVEFIVAWRSRTSWTWLRTASIYSLLFAATIVIQSYARKI